jgi:hypothetical protein
MSDATNAGTNDSADAAMNDPQLPPNPVGPNPGDREPAEGGEVPDAGPGAERADDDSVSGSGGAG